MSDIFVDQGFRTHFIVYIVVNLMLIAINLITAPGTYWFIWPLFGWGLGVLGHAVGVGGASKEQH